jgi:GT2 family glycosyltransferase
MAKLSVNLVAWNGAKYIPYLFASLKAQTYTDWELKVLDNCSSDDTVAAIERELKGSAIKAQIIRNDSNRGFACGHNRLYKETATEYFLLLNQDMYLEPNVFERLVNFMESEPLCAAASPRLMKWNFANISSGINNSFTNQIDTLGLRVYRHRQVVEKSTGDTWPVPALAGQNYVEVFGLSGALFMMRRGAAVKVAFSDGTLFDESYHSYREDIDLAYRLRSAGFQSHVLLDVAAYHDRTAVGVTDTSNIAAISNKKNQSRLVKYLSYKNQLATLYKNEYCRNFMLDWPWILWYELKKFAFYLFTMPSVLKGPAELVKDSRELAKKRREIKRKRICSWRQMRHWWK